MANNDKNYLNLINLRDRPKEERIEIARKGGSVKSKRKSIANSIHRLKSGKFSKFFSVKATALIKNPDLFAEFIISHVFELRDKPLSNAEAINLVKATADFYTKLYGAKLEVNDRRTTADEVIKRLEEIKENENNPEWKKRKLEE